MKNRNFTFSTSVSPFKFYTNKNGWKIEILRSLSNDATKFLFSLKKTVLTPKERKIINARIKNNCMWV